MTEKVFGFKEKDFKKEIGKPYYPDFYVVDESKLVPVVSLEWLEREIGEKAKYSALLRDLLLAAKKAVEKK